MLEQIAFSRTGDFLAFMNGLSQTGDAQSLIHGIFIDLHPTWKNIVDGEINTGIQDWDGSFPGSDQYDSQSPLERSRGVGKYDLSYFPRRWVRTCERVQRAPSPFIVIIYVTPTSRDTTPGRRHLEDYARKQPFFTIVIEAPIATFAATIQGGAEITATSSGTIGGFLRDASGTAWGVTCGHVATNPGGNVDLEDAGGTTVTGAGIVRHTNFQQFQGAPAPGFCNPYVGSTPTVDVDGALFEISSGHSVVSRVKSVGQIDSIYDRGQLGSGCVVAMSGAITGRQDYEIGAYGVTCKVAMHSNATKFCFSDVFEFYAPGTGPGWAPRRVLQMFAPRPVPGDSGSWLCFNHSGVDHAYFGNLIAVRGPVGIATFADSLVKWADQTANLKLAPF